MITHHSGGPHFALDLRLKNCVPLGPIEEAIVNFVIPHFIYENSMGVWKSAGSKSGVIRVSGCR